MSSMPMDLDSPHAKASEGLIGLGRSINGMPATAKVMDVISTFRPTKLFRREAHDKPTTITSLDYDNQGDRLMTVESDESVQIYNVKEGKHDHSCYSKKYGVKLAKFTHKASCIIFASAKGVDTIRYLSTHDNTFLRYFAGHEKPVTCLAMNPGADTFLSCSKDNTVRLWDINSTNCCGKLLLSQPCLTAWDPSANVFAVASEAAQTILLYDSRNYDKEPFAVFDLLSFSNAVQSNSFIRNWNKLEFSNDGKSLLLATTGHSHLLLDAFEGHAKSFLVRNRNGPKRVAAGEEPRPDPPGATPSDPIPETSGDACFSPDGRYVISGQQGENVLVWDTLSQASNQTLYPAYELEMKAEAAVLAFNPRYNFFASADKELVFWLPDPNVNL